MVFQLDQQLKIKVPELVSFQIYSEKLAALFYLDSTDCLFFDKCQLTPYLHPKTFKWKVYLEKQKTSPESFSFGSLYQSI